MNEMIECSWIRNGLLYAWQEHVPQIAFLTKCHLRCARTLPLRLRSWRAIQASGFLLRNQRSGFGAYLLFEAEVHVQRRVSCSILLNTRQLCTLRVTIMQERVPIRWALEVFRRNPWAICDILNLEMLQTLHNLAIHGRSAFRRASFCRTRSFWARTPSFCCEIIREFRKQYKSTFPPTLTGN